MPVSFFGDDPPSPPAPLSPDPALSFSPEPRTLSNHSRPSSQSSSSIPTRCPSPVVPDNEPLEESGSSDECKTFYEYADDRNPLVWYRVSLLGPFAPFPGLPAAISRLIDDLENRQAEAEPPWRSSMWDRYERHRRWEYSIPEDIRLYFQGPGPSLFPGGHPTTQDNVSGNAIYDHLMRRVDNQTPTEPLTPDVIYGYREDTLHRSGGIPSWVIDDGKAAEARLFYPFLTIQMGGHDLDTGRDMQRATDDCMITSSISVRMLDKLNQRLAICQRGGKSTTINSSAFSIAMNGAVARIYVTFAWDETRDYVYNIASFVLEDPSHHRKFHQYAQSIIDWGKNERLQEIRDAIEVIETHNPPWYPRYQR